ncbi:MAG: N-acetyltransferase, partial [Gammaproteobacteria bacterium PRO9]|nr:N-acetyltransferase [Gammaproteobacteria bacterium PRO9]
LEFARSQGWKVRPVCSYAVAWMNRHPEYAGLRI